MLDAEVFRSRSLMNEERLRVKLREFKDTVTVDDAFEISGGYGSFQKISSIFMIMAMGSVAFFLYAFSFLEHRPKY